MNNQKEINKLLSQFYAGNTSTVEEMELYRLLIDQPKEIDYTAEQLAFIAMIETTDHIDSDAWSDQDQQLADWLDSEILKEKKTKAPLIRHIFRWKRYAAAVIVMVGVGALTLLMDRTATEPLALRNGQTISQEEASLEVQRSLQLLANCFEYTEQATQKTSDTFSDINRILDKSKISTKKD